MICQVTTGVAQHTRIQSLWHTHAQHRKCASGWSWRRLTHEYTDA